ncbi:MAG: nitrogenase component 1 [Eubacteriales bacterium]|nr:nitrogenase component 1 [Eubacteriales bacterium]
MINNCLSSTLDKRECIRPDSLTGMIFAMEGIHGAMVLLNGPMGCKFYHSTTSQFLTMRPALYLPEKSTGRKVPVDYNYLNDWFFRQPRVPSTSLDGQDYVYGTAEKVEAALVYIREHVSFDLLAVINSPGACLIGDHLQELVKRILPDRNCIMLESPGFSMEFDNGYEDAVVELLKQMGGKLKARNLKENPYVSPAAENLLIPTECGGSAAEQSGSAPGQSEITVGEQNERRKSVNLIGSSIWDRYAEGDRNEWKRMLGLCGIEVNCCLCSGNTMEELLRIPEADLNVVIDTARGRAAAQYLQETYGQPFYSCPGLPVGFAAAERIIGDICSLLQAENKAFAEDSRRARAVCYGKIRDIYDMCGLPNEASFAVAGSEGQKRAFGSFLRSYLKMREVPKEEAELVFGDANTIAQLKLLEKGNHVFCGIEINNPGMGYTDVIPKTQMGVHGAMFLVEQVLNGLMSKL